MPPDISEAGHLLDSLIWTSLWLITGVFVLVVVVLGYCILAFRAGPTRKASYFAGNSRGAVALMLALALAVFFGIDLHLAVLDHFVFAAMWDEPMAAHKREGSIEIQLLAERFSWNFRYAGKDGIFGTDDDVTPAVLVVPKGERIVLRMQSKDVIHSAFLPNLRIKQDVVPGLTTAMVFSAQQTGKYEIACAELCGNQHSYMRGELVVLESRAEYDRWLDEYRAEYEPKQAKWAIWNQGVKTVRKAP